MGIASIARTEQVEVATTCRKFATSDLGIVNCDEIRMCLLSGQNVADHPAAGEVVSTPEAADPPLGCIGLLGLFLRSFKRSPTSFSRERKSAKIRATS
jgi:hypothetical protein